MLAEVVVASEELERLTNATSEELETWLTQQVRDQFGTFAPLLRAIEWAKRGAFARARADVDAALDKQPTYEIVELIGALISYVTRDYDRALTLLGKIAASHQYIAAQTLRVLEARAARLGWIAEQDAASEQLAVLGVRDLRAHVRGLQRARASVDPRDPEAAARWLWTTHEHRPEQLGLELDAILARAPKVGSVKGLRARVHLRLGQLERAVALLSDVQSEAVSERWAASLAQGRARELVEEPLPATAGVRLLLLRAEAQLELGELAQAAAQVDAAAQRSPRRSAAAELLRILIDARKLGRGPTRERFAELYALAPGLLSDAARELELGLWIDGGLLDEPASLLRCCERARQLWTADRSVRLWYTTRSLDGEQRLRCGHAPGPRPHAHEHDREDLEQATALLLRTLAKRERAAKPRQLASDRALAPKQIERFIADGYVHLRGAFSRTLAQAVIREAQQRLGAQLPGYDPDDPESWPEGRVDLLGSRRFAIREFSRPCERAIAQLLGGPQRVRTRSWTDNLIIAFPSKTTPEIITPERDWISWHLDAPHVDTRLDNIRAGLLVFIVFGDLEPRSGNTWLALDSPGKVARTLAANPDGVDFLRPETAPGIVRECERLLELTAAAGDIFLVHPLMLHSASANPSTRIRWLGNPMIYVDGVLDHRRAEPSPVELVIARALARR